MSMYYAEKDQSCVFKTIFFCFIISSILNSYGKN